MKQENEKQLLQIASWYDHDETVQKYKNARNAFPSDIITYRVKKETTNRLTDWPHKILFKYFEVLGYYCYCLMIIIIIIVTLWLH